MHVQRSKAEEKTPKFRDISDDLVFPLRESNSILSDKVKEFTIEELFRSPFTELTFKFYYKKEFMLEVLIQIRQNLKKLVENVIHIFFLFNAIL